MKDRNSLKKTNQQLEESRGLYRLIIDSVKDYAILMLNPDGIINSWNAGAETMKLYKSSEIIGKHFSIFYPEKARKDNFPQFELEHALANGRFEDEGWRIRKDGSRFWANVVIAPIYTADNEHIGYVKVTRDMTESLHNRALMDKNKELQRLNNDLDNFIYIASHDLKAPIANLEGLLALMKKRTDGGIVDDRQSLLEMMESSVAKLRQTIEELAEIKRIQNLENQKENVSFNQAIDEVTNEIVRLIDSSGAKITRSIKVNEAFFSPHHLKTVIYNLLSNAIMYRSPERPLKIKISTFMKDGRPVLSIKDNGLGLSEDQVGKAFNMFKRFHAHTKGSGMGLYIVKRIIEDNQGWIEVNSMLSEGTEFIVHFAHPEIENEF